MKRFLLVLLVLIFSFAVFGDSKVISELHYIEISQKENLPLVRVKTLDDFEKIIPARGDGFSKSEKSVL